VCLSGYVTSLSVRQIIKQGWPQRGWRKMHIKYNNRCSLLSFWQWAVLLLYVRLGDLRHSSSLSWNLMYDVAGLSGHPFHTASTSDVITVQIIGNGIEGSGFYLTWGTATPLFRSDWGSLNRLCPGCERNPASIKYETGISVCNLSLMEAGITQLV